MTNLKKQKITGLKRIALTGTILLLTLQPAFSLPVVTEVTSGTTTLSSDSSTLTINASDKTIINYSSFDVAAGESVIINLPSVDSSILNRVLGSSATNISGNITCNGVFILVNERGIYLGSTANIDAASVILSTRDISDTNFLSSKYIFSRISKDQMDSLISNQGTINVHDGGFGILIAGAIENQGVVTAKVGTIALAAGDMVHVDISNTGRISIAIDKAQADTVLDANGNPVTDQIKNTGTLSSQGGVVLMKASAIGGLFEKAINLEGYVKANSYDEKDGLIKIVTSEDVVSKAEISATRIEIGSEDEGIIPYNVELTGGAITAGDGGIEILANNNITTSIDITAYNSDIRLFADYEGDGLGEFTQNAGVIETTGVGDIYIDGSGTMKLGEISTETGAIIIGATRTPVEITGNPSYIHRSGDFIIDRIESGLMTTTLGDLLRYNPAGDLSLEATTGAILSLSPVAIKANNLKLTANAIDITSAAITTELYKNIGDINLVNSISLNNDWINLTGVDIDLTYIKTNNLTLRSDNAVNATAGVIISGNEVKIRANYFGNMYIPLTIQANKTYIERLSGNIDIMESLGIGTSMMLRGPPDGFGAIIYNQDTDLSLTTNSGNIYIYPAATISADSLFLRASGDMGLSGSLIIPNSTNLYASGSIINSGLINTKTLIEEGYTFRSTGTITGGTAHFNNLDGAADIGGSIGSSVTDTGDLNVISNIILTADNLTFTAGTSGTGAFISNSFSINSNTGTHYNLIINVASNSTLGAIGTTQSLGDLTLGRSAGLNTPAFTLLGDIVLTGSFAANTNITLTPGAFNITLGGNFGNNANVNAWTGLITFNGGITQTLFDNAGQNLGNIRISAGTGGNTTVVLNSDISCGSVTIDAGQTLDASRSGTGFHNITTSGNWTNNGTYTYGTAVDDGSSVVFTGTSAIVTTGGTGAGKDFYDFTVYTSGTVTLNGNLNTVNSLNLYAGTLDIANYTVTVGLNLMAINLFGADSTSAILASGGSITIAGSILVASIQNGYQETFNLTGFTGTINANGLGILGSGDIGQSISAEGDSVLNLGDNLTLNLGKINSELPIDGDSFYMEGSVSGTNTVNAGASTWALTGDFELLGGGMFNAQNSTISVAENWINNGNFGSAGTGEIIFNGISIISGNDIGFHDLTITGILTAPSSAMSITGDLVNNGTFNVNGCTITFDGTTTISGTSTTSLHNVFVLGGLTLPSGNINVSGNWNASGTVNANNGTITFNGGDATISTGSLNSFSNVIINSTGIKTLSGVMTVAGNLTLTDGTLAVGTNNLLVSGNSSITGATVTIGASTGTGWTTTDLTIGTDGIVTCSGASLISASGDWDSSAGTLNSGNSIVNLTGTGTIKGSTFGAINPNAFYSLILANNGQTTTMLSELTTNFLTVGDNTGVLTDGAESHFIHIYTNSGNIFTDGGASLELNAILIIPNVQGTTLTIPARDYTFTTVPGGVGLEILQIEAAAGIGGNTTYNLTGNIITNGLIINVNNTTGQTNTCILETNNFSINASSIILGMNGKTNEFGQLNSGSSIITVSGNVDIFTSDGYGNSALYVDDSTWTIGGNLNVYDIINIDTGTMTITGNLTIGTGGNASLGSGTLNVAGNWDSSAGTLLAETGTVNLTGTGTIRIPADVHEYFYQLSLAAGGETTTILDNVSTRHLTLGSGTVTDGNNSYLILVEFNDQINILTDAGAQLDIYCLTFISKISGTGETLLEFSDYNLYSRSLELLYLEGNGSTGDDWTYKLGNDTTLNNLQISTNNGTGYAGTSILDTNGYDITAYGSITIGQDPTRYGRLDSGSSTITTDNVDIKTTDNNGSNTINAESSTWNVGGSWTNRDIFNAGTSTISFVDNSGTSYISGNTTFNDLTSTVSGKTLAFEAGSTQTITGITTISGANLISASPGARWYIDPQGTIDISSVYVKDSVNLNGVDINPLNSTDGGNNLHWFTIKDIPWTFDFISKFWYEEAKLKKRLYKKNKYVTTVVVYEGKVLVTPYNEEGLKLDEQVTLIGGQSTTQRGEII